MARRILGARRFVRPAGRTTLWLSAGVTNTTVGGGALVLFASLNAGALALRPFTVVRTRITMSATSDQLAATELSQGVLALQVVTETAVAAGIASVPTGITEADADFFVYQPWINSIVSATSVGIIENGGAGNSWIIDSKAMRKVGTDDDIVTTVENRTAGGINIALEGRILIKLH